MRDELALAIQGDLEIVKPARLLHLIHQGLLAIDRKEKKSSAAGQQTYDIFSNRFLPFQDLQDEIPKGIINKAKF